MMSLTPQEQAVLNVFRGKSLPKLRFQQVATAELKAKERAAATDSLVKKGVLGPLGSGEYWLTDQGVQLLELS